MGTDTLLQKKLYSKVLLELLGLQSTSVCGQAEGIKNLYLGIQKIVILPILSECQIYMKGN